MSIFVDLGVGVYTIKMVSDANVSRKYYKVKATSKQKRKMIRMKKKKSDNINRKEGITYESGGF